MGSNVVAPPLSITVLAFYDRPGPDLAPVTALGGVLSAGYFNPSRSARFSGGPRKSVGRRESAVVFNDLKHGTVVGYPTCVAARASLMTGLSPARTAASVIRMEFPGTIPSRCPGCSPTPATRPAASFSATRFRRIMRTHQAGFSRGYFPFSLGVLSSAETGNVPRSPLFASSP